MEDVSDTKEKLEAYLKANLRQQLDHGLAYLTDVPLSF